MRFLVQLTFPVEPFNDAVRDQTAGSTIQRILETQQPEAVYFWEQDGRRGGILVVDMENPSEIPSIAEPWFLAFDAGVQFHPAMTPEDLAKADLDTLGQKWG